MSRVTTRPLRDDDHEALLSDRVISLVEKYISAVPELPEVALDGIIDLRGVEPVKLTKRENLIACHAMSATLYLIADMGPDAAFFFMQEYARRFIELRDEQRKEPPPQ